MNNIQRATDFRGLYTQTLLNTQTGEGACFLPYLQKQTRTMIKKEVFKLIIGFKSKADIRIS